MKPSLYSLIQTGLCAIALIAVASGRDIHAAPAQTVAATRPAINVVDATPRRTLRIMGPHIVVDAQTGAVLSHYDAVRPWFPASTTKLMTLYVALRAIAAGQATLDRLVTVSEHAAAQPPSKMGFKPGTELTLDNALKIMMVKSANDIAFAVAETIGGTEAGFAVRMNMEAQRLGMTESQFVNPHGLPEARQITSARDMAVLGRALLADFPQYRHYLNIHAIEFGGKVMKTYNPLLERYPGATGMKTGFVCGSGYNLVASARRGDRELIAVVFGAYGGKARAEEAAELLEAGFLQPAPATQAPTTLANVASGARYAAPFDMRPEVCGARKAATASEANTDGISDPAKVLLLGAPRYLGPPVKVSVVAMANPNAKPGQPGYVARLPKPRPERPSDRSEPETANAFAPVMEGGDAAAGPEQAIAR